MRKLPNHTALKEWSSVIESLGSGHSVVLIRKGGIADPAFGLEADEFYLYPTYFHANEDEHRRVVTITHWCETVRTWRVTNAALLPQLETVVALPPATLEARYRFRPDQALHVIGVRTFALREATTVHFRDEYAGCRSWVSVDEEIDVEGSTPVLDDDALQERLEGVDALLGHAAESLTR